jgi:hypothetical protein
MKNTFNPTMKRLVVTAVAAIGLGVTSGCAETLISRADPYVLLTTAQEVPQGYRVLGTAHVQSSTTSILFFKVGPTMEDLNQMLIKEARNMGGNAVIGVQYSQSWFTYQANGTVVKVGK